ncbi:MAG: Na(+)-translocating NADH-quinone reductase subunit A [Bacteroidota bacterium]|nr:Na(+)-translocating NADH-quinone reductase subunit A [Bacteroidota bacterium]
MSKPVKISRGLDIPIKGKAKPTETETEKPLLYALKPTDFHGLRPKVVAKPGMHVKAGSVVFYNKFHPDVKFCSPVSGEVIDVIRGEKRKILEIIIKSDGKQDTETFDIPDLNDAKSGDIKSVMLESGLWPLIVQRPFGIIPPPGDSPDAVFVSLFNTAPLAPDMDFVMKDQTDDLKTGAEVMHKLTGKNIHFGLSVNSDDKLYNDIPHAEFYHFKGPHPAGNVGTQINKIRPINKDEIFWTLKPQDLAVIGRFFREKSYKPWRKIAFAGSELKETFYAKVLPGASLKHIVEQYRTQDNVRMIGGDVLTGSKLNDNAFLGYHDDMISVIPEGDYYEFFGWVKPGFNKYTASRNYFSWMIPGKKYRLNTNFHGGHRAYVMTGEYEKVCPLDIYPLYLIKACLTEDIDKMEELGIYEVLEEDLALCEFVCTSKTEVQQILRESLDMLRKELS